MFLWPKHTRMKKLILTFFAVTAAASVFAQGNVYFDNRTSLGTTHIWGPSSTMPYLSLIGAGTNDNPPGTINYAARGMSMIGAGGLSQAQSFRAQLLAANGAGQPESSLTPQGATTTFRTGAAQGNLAGITVTLGNVPPDAAAATLEMVVWDNSSGLYPTWTEAYPAWLSGLVGTWGKSGPFTVYNIGGSINTPPSMLIPSFNLIGTPEPSTLGLTGLGLAALWLLRRRT